jgi:hypothetical protein
MTGEWTRSSWCTPKCPLLTQSGHHLEKIISVMQFFASALPMSRQIVMWFKFLILKFLIGFFRKFLNLDSATIFSLEQIQFWLHILTPNDITVQDSQTCANGDF